MIGRNRRVYGRETSKCSRSGFLRPRINYGASSFQRRDWAATPPRSSFRRLTPESKVFLLGLRTLKPENKNKKTGPWIPPSSAGMTVMGCAAMAPGVQAYFRRWVWLDMVLGMYIFRIVRRKPVTVSYKAARKDRQYR